MAIVINVHIYGTGHSRFIWIEKLAIATATKYQRLSISATQPENKLRTVVAHFVTKGAGIAFRSC